VKKGIVLFLCAALIFTLSACGSAGSGGQSGDGGASGGGEGETVELRMTWWGSQIRHELTMKALKLFEEKHPNIKIKAEYSGWDGYFDKLSTQVAGSNAPDLIQMDYAFLTDYAKRGALLELDPYVEQNILNIADHDQSMIEAGSVDGKLYAITLGLNAPGVIYNATVFEELGIEEPKQDWTWEDFQNIAKQISDAKGNGYYGTADVSRTANQFQIMARQHGEQFLEETKLGASKETLTKWFTMWNDMVKSGAATPPEVTAAATESPETRPITLGTAAMDFAWSNQVKTFQSLMKNNDKIKIQVIPHGKDEKKIGEYLKPGQFISGYAKTKHPKEVAMVIDFLVNDPEAAEILGAERGIPVNSKIRKQLKSSMPEEDQMIFEFIDVVAENSSLIDPPYPQGYSEIEKNFRTLSEEIAFGSKPMDQAIDQFIAETNKILGKNK